MQGQNVEGQVIASQYQYKVAGYAPNTYSWPGGTCNASGPLKQFAFWAPPSGAAAPVTIVDGSPALTETVTPTAVLDNNQTCAISIAAVNSHQVPFFIQSGTGGLQEALNQNMTTPATNTVILNSAWYQSVGTANAQAVIAAAKGSIELGLVDVTTVPTSYYSWNGTQYIAVAAGGGASAPATTLVYKGTGGPNGIIPATPGVDYVIPSGSITGNAGTATNVAYTGLTGPVTIWNQNTTGLAATASALAAAGTPCIIGYAGTGVDVHGNSLNCQAIGSGGGGGGPGSALQLGAYLTSGNTVSGAPGLYALQPTTTLLQANAFFAAAPSGTTTAILPQGMAQLPFTNNSVHTKDLRQGADYLQISQFGVVCDGGQTPLTVSLTAGSNLVSVGSLIGAVTDIGKTMTFTVQTGYGYQSPQYSWTPTITAYTYPNFSLSSNAPFNFSGFAQLGTDNSAPNAGNPGGVSNIQNAMNSAGGSPLSIPVGCRMLVAQPIAWNNGQSLIGQQAQFGGFIGGPGQDILQQPDASGQGKATAAGLRVEDVGFTLDSGVDPTGIVGGPWTSYNAAGTPTVHTPLYRPLYQHTPLANQPCAPGWVLNCTNGVASTAQNSSVICVPTALGRVPAVGQTIMFPYFTTIFTATVSSNTGAGCSAGFTGTTLSTALPNTSGYTVAQAEWFTGTAIQSTTTTIPTTITYPLTLTLTLSTAPIPGFESNFAQHGHIKVCGIEADYMGSNSYGPYTAILRRGPATSAGCSGTTVIAPMNPCPAKNLFGSSSDQPWPVIPSINTNDSTPSGANWFPGECGGAAALSFPTANAQTFANTGLTNSFLEHLYFGTTQIQNTNGTQDFYSASNAVPYAVDMGGFNSNGVMFGIMQGAASAGQHYIGPVGPTGTGNHIHDMSFRGAYPLALVDFQQSFIARLDNYSTEISPYDGTAVGATTCLYQGYTLDEQTGSLVTFNAQNQTTVAACEPENGSHIEVNPYVVDDGFGNTYDNVDFEDVPTYWGGSGHTITNSQMSLPALNYGDNNDLGDLSGGNSQYFTNVWNVHPQFYNWGTNSKCEVYAGGGGPPTHCGAGFAQGYTGHSNEASITGNNVHPYENALGGMIHPGEWNTNYSFDSDPMSAQNVQDPTEPFWANYAACNLGGAALCRPESFDGFNGSIYIGPHQRLVDGPYVASMDLKTVAAGSTVTIQISAFDSGTGQCSSAGSISSGTFTTTTAWQPFSFPVDFTGRAGCILQIQFYNATTTDQLRVGYFNFVPVPGQVLLPTASPTIGASCSGPNAIIGSNSSGPLSCVGGLVVAGSGGGSMVYPGAGIPNSTGTAWGTSYTTTGSGTVVPLQTSPTLITPNIGAATGTSVTLTNGTLSGINGLGTAVYTLGATAQVGTGATTPTAVSGVINDSLSGTLTFTTGTGSLAAGTILTITLPGTRVNIPTCPIEVTGGTTFLGPEDVASNTTGQVALTVTTEVALAASTAYRIKYGVCGGT
jgi:hypothetical protein